MPHDSLTAAELQALINTFQKINTEWMEYDDQRHSEKNPFRKTYRFYSDLSSSSNPGSLAKLWIYEVRKIIGYFACYCGGLWNEDYEEVRDVVSVELIRICGHLRRLCDEREGLEKERLSKERIEKENFERDQRERLREKTDTARQENETREQEQRDKEQRKKERIESERRETLRDQLETARREREQHEKELVEKQGLQRKQLEREGREKKRLEKERLEKERLDTIRLVNARLAVGTIFFIP